MSPKNKLDIYLTKLRAYYRSEGALPSFARACEVFGLRSKGAIAKIFARFVAEGFLMHSDGEYTPTSKLRSLPLFQSVRAGFPSPATEENRYDIDLDSYLIEHPSSTVLVHIKGDSMRDAGILEGDIAIVTRGQTPKAGDIVLAIVDGDYTVKYFYKDRGSIILRPANPSYPDIHARENLEIYGVVTGSVRKY